ncbi:NAD-dependent epimerase/dehydratase family protein [Shimia marina]|uniref:NAD-dependent epimerase/dehydratase family protein n=1 Tax=Shimia marina TaxID=321267 RepID=UPI0008EE6956|nr:NAD-dependent epimerase/dehydratase family protein [Shimia marina]SFE30501.1 Nucleoside-diphosphate-sugar epimerase [Shimia marina]
MKVFTLGGTGSIGTGVVKELRNRNHDVYALSRSSVSDSKLSRAGAHPIRGEMENPDSWINQAIQCDAIIQVAATFDDDMGDLDQRTTQAIIAASERDPELAVTPRRFIYTGGCWLYGETGDDIATETSEFRPLQAFDWMLKHYEALLNCRTLSTAIIHPAMVYHEEGGVFEDFHRAATQGQALEIWGSADTRWPLIERGDLARAYCDLLERHDLVGHFNAVGEEGVRVGNIAHSFTARVGGLPEPVILNVPDLVRDYGEWAAGPALDQQLSAEKLRDATGWSAKVTDYRTSALLRSL